MNKKIVSISIATVLGLALAGGVAFADTSNAMKVSISNSGKITLTGNVVSVSGSTISMTSWLGTWSVDASHATFAGNHVLADVVAGQTIIVHGTASLTNLSVTADTIESKGLDREQAKTVFSGTVGNVNALAGTFTLDTKNLGSLTVFTSSGTQVLINGNVSSVASLVDKMTALVFGSLNPTNHTVAATKVIAPVPFKGDMHAAMEFKFLKGKSHGKHKGFAKNHQNQE